MIMSKALRVKDIVYYLSDPIIGNIYTHDFIPL